MTEARSPRRKRASLPPPPPGPAPFHRVPIGARFDLDGETLTKITFRARPVGDHGVRPMNARRRVDGKWRYRFVEASAVVTVLGQEDGDARTE